MSKKIPSLQNRMCSFLIEKKKHYRNTNFLQVRCAGLHLNELEDLTVAKIELYRHLLIGIFFASVFAGKLLKNKIRCRNEYSEKGHVVLHE